MPSKFYYHGALIISSLNPPTGPTKGGTAVALHGFFEQVAEVRCRFGIASTALVAPRFVDASRIECTSTAQDVPQMQVVQLAANGQQFCNASISFAYHAPLAVASLLPTVAKSEGDTMMLVRTNRGLPLGAAMQGYRFCHFGGLTVPASARTRDALVCATPAIAPGYVTVEISVNAQDFTATGVQVQIVQVTMIAIEPLSGPRLGGTRVMVHGSNLLSVLSCLFGGQLAAVSETHGKSRMVCATADFQAMGWVSVQFAEGATVSLYFAAHSCPRLSQRS